MIIFKTLRSQRFLFFLAPTFCVSLLSLGLAPTRCQAQPAIFAGEGMGQIHIGETRASVLKKLGKPTQSLRWESVPLLQDTWTSKKSNSRLVVLYSIGHQRVLQVETTSPKFYTPTGMSVGSSAADALTFLGKGKNGLLLKTLGSSKPQYYTLMYHTQKGIAFFFNMTQKDISRGKCEKIMVFSSPMPLPFFSPTTYQMVGAEEFMRNRSKG